MLKYILLAFVQAQLWCLNCLYSELEKLVIGRLDIFGRAQDGTFFASLWIFFETNQTFPTLLSKCSVSLVVLLCALAAGLSQLCDGGDQEEDAGDEGGEGQPDGPLWQLRAGWRQLLISFEHRCESVLPNSGLFYHWPHSYSEQSLQVGLRQIYPIIMIMETTAQNSIDWQRHLSRVEYWIWMSKNRQLHTLVPLKPSWIFLN